MLEVPGIGAGVVRLFEILTEAIDRGYEYVLITEHTSGLRFGELDGRALVRQAVDIEEARGRSQTCS